MRLYLALLGRPYFLTYLEVRQVSKALRRRDVTYLERCAHGTCAGCCSLLEERSSRGQRKVKVHMRKHRGR